MSNTQAVAVSKPNGAIAGLAGQPSYAELVAKVAELQAQADAKRNQKLTIRVMDVKADGTAGNGGIAVFGLQRFPVVLYAEQWEKVLVPETIAAILAECKSPKASRKAR